MACPKCGCKVVYPVYDPEDYEGKTEDMYQCPNCGYTFWIEEGDDDEDEYIEDPSIDPEYNPLE